MTSLLKGWKDVLAWGEGMSELSVHPYQPGLKDIPRKGDIISSQSPDEQGLKAIEL